MCYVAIGVAICVGHSTVCCIPICACLQIHLEVLRPDTTKDSGHTRETTFLSMGRALGQEGSRMVQHHQGQVKLVE